MRKGHLFLLAAMMMGTLGVTGCRGMSLPEGDRDPMGDEPQSGDPQSGDPQSGDPQSGDPGAQGSADDPGQDPQASGSERRRNRWAKWRERRGEWRKHRRQGRGRWHGRRGRRHAERADEEAQ
jgi:hypothetical protein